MARNDTPRCGHYFLHDSVVISIEAPPKEATMYTLRSNRNTVHIEGIPAGTKFTGDGDDNTSGVVAYYAQSACAALTRGATRMAVGESFHTLADALATATTYADARGLKVCTRCTAAAERYLAETMFMCTTCGTTDPSTLCLVPDPYHPGGRELTRAAYEQYKADHYPTAPLVAGPEPELAARIEAAGARAAAANTHLSPTAQAKVAASAARDEAMRIAYEAEGTPGETAADAAYAAADAANAAAADAHRAACEAWVSPRDTPAPAPEPVEDTAPSTVRIRRHNRTTVHAAIVTSGTHAGRDEGDELVTLCGTPGPSGNKLRGWLVLGDEERVTCERCGADPEEPAPAAVEEAPTYAACPVKWVTGEPCEGCRARAKAIAANAALTPDRAASYMRMGGALTTDNTDHQEAPPMSKYEVIINQVVTTTVYLEATDREAAEALAIAELPDLCAQCGGMGPRDSANVTDVNRYVNDHYDEPQVTELDEHGCIPATPDETLAAPERFTVATHTPTTAHDIGGIAADLNTQYDMVLFDIDPQGHPRPFTISGSPSLLVNPDPVNLEDLPPSIMAGRHLEPATREHLAAVNILDIFERMNERERAYHLAQREYLYCAERYARTGDSEDCERAENILENYQAAAVAAGRCAAIGLDWSCVERTANDAPYCPAHRGTVTGKETDRG